MDGLLWSDWGKKVHNENQEEELICLQKMMLNALLNACVYVFVYGCGAHARVCVCVCVKDKGWKQSTY